MTSNTRFPRSVFVAHSSEDAPFATVLLKHLSAEGIVGWHDPDDYLTEDGSPAVLSKGLLETESLVVLLSPSSLGSELVRAQIQAFVPAKSKGQVLVLLLEPVVPGHPMLRDLEGVVSINASVSKLSGMRLLTAELLSTDASVSGAEVGVPPAPVIEHLMTRRLLRELNKLSQLRPEINPKQPLPLAKRQALLLDIMTAFQEPLERKFRLINPIDGKATSLPPGVLEELVLDSQADYEGLLTSVPEFFVRTVSSLLAEAFHVEPRFAHRDEKRIATAETLATPPSVQPAQVEALRKFSTLARRINTTPATV
jgi:TIR domain